MTDFNQTHQNDTAGTGNKSVTSADLENVWKGHISQSNISYCQTDLIQLSFKNDDTTYGIVAFMCAGPYFFAPDNCLLYIDAPH